MTDPFARQDPAGSEALASWPAQCSPSGLLLGSALGSALGSVLGSALRMRSALGLVDEGRAMVSAELERLSCTAPALLPSPPCRRLDRRLPGRSDAKSDFGTTARWEREEKGDGDGWRGRVAGKGEGWG